MLNNLHLVLGGPGCGKTTRLLEIAHEHYQRGYKPNELAFVSFTRAAASEAKNRAREGFMFNDDDLRYYSTIHAMAYRLLGLDKKQVMKRDDYKEISKLSGVKVTGNRANISDLASAQKGDRMLFTYDYARNCKMSIEDGFSVIDSDGKYSMWELRKLARVIDMYKEKTGKVDFMDMLVDFMKHCDPVDVRIAIIDEAQDLTPLQWDVVNYAFGKCEMVYAGGDDDQAIYKWAGASVETFLGLEATKEILPHSWRLNNKVFSFSQSIAKRIKHRYDKKFTCGNHDGKVNYVNKIDEIDMSSGEWLLMCRNRYQSSLYKKYLREQGYIYHIHGESSMVLEHYNVIRYWERWRRCEMLTMPQINLLIQYIPGTQPMCNHEGLYAAEDWGWQEMPPWYVVLSDMKLGHETWYYRRCFRNGEKPTEKPRIRITTIHGAKGSESENTVIATDMSHKTYMWNEKSPDDEHRVFYVAATRAKNNVFIVMPQTDKGYKMPK